MFVDMICSCGKKFQGCLMSICDDCLDRLNDRIVEYKKENPDATTMPITDAEFVEFFSVPDGRRN